MNENPVSFAHAIHRVMQALIGVVFVLLAVGFVVWPLPSYAAVGLVFGVAVLLTGILEVVYAIFWRHTLAGWGWHLAAGILDVFIGLYLNAYPLASLTIIPVLAAFWLIWRGLTLCGHAATQHPAPYVQWGFGIGGVAWGLIMLWWPAEGVMTVVYLLAVGFAMTGIWRLIFAFRK